MSQFFVFFATAKGAGVQAVTAATAQDAEAQIRRKSEAILRLSVVAGDWLGDLDRKAMLREWMASIRDEIDPT